MATIIEINFDRRQIKIDIYVNDNILDLPFLQGKLIQEWFKEVTFGGGTWKGLLPELKEAINSNDFYLEFISDAKSKVVFYEHLEVEGVDIVEDEDSRLFLDFNIIAHNNYETALCYLDLSCLGKRCLEKSDEELARKYFLKSAEGGHVLGKFELGKCYYYGIGGDPDEEKSVYWLKKAIEMGCIEAQEELSTIREEDEETRKYNRDMMMLTEQFNSLNNLNTAMLDLEE